MINAFEEGKAITDFVNTHMREISSSIIDELANYGFTNLSSRAFYIWADEQYHDAGFHIFGSGISAAVDFLGFGETVVSVNALKKELPITASAKEICEAIIGMLSPDVVVKKRLSKNPDSPQ